MYRVAGGKEGVRKTYLSYLICIEAKFLFLPKAAADSRPDLAFFAAGASPNTSQNLSVSSAPAEHTCPFGPAAKCSTRAVCPVSSFTFSIEGYFHKQS